MSNQNRGRGGGRNGTNRQRGDRRGNNPKQSQHEALYHEFQPFIEGCGMSKKTIISRMKKENINKDKMSDFVSSLHEASPTPSKPQAAEWDTVPSKFSKKKQQGSRTVGNRGGNATRGRGNERGGRGDRGRSAPGRSDYRSGGGSANRRSDLDSKGRDRNNGPRITASNATFAFGNQEKKEENKTDAAPTDTAVKEKKTAVNKSNSADVKKGKNLTKKTFTAAAVPSGNPWAKGGQNIIAKVKDEEKKKQEAIEHQKRVADGSFAREQAKAKACSSEEKTDKCRSNCRCKKTGR